MIVSKIVFGMESMHLYICKDAIGWFQALDIFIVVCIAIMKKLPMWYLFMPMSLNTSTTR